MRNELIQSLELKSELSHRRTTDRLKYYEPYPKQREFHKAGAKHRERLFMAGNQSGKTLAGGFEIGMHLTGIYPDWWEGRRFDRPTRWWCGGKDRNIHRDAAQRMLLGNPEDPEALGTGTIPQKCIIKVVRAAGIANSYDFVMVKHISGGNSYLGFKTYDQKRAAWQGPTLDGIWFDEEPPHAIYTEGLTRTNSTLGPVFTTFTPLLGMSQVVSQFLQSDSPQKHTTTMTLYDVGHYTEEDINVIIESYPPHERDARVRGTPMLGSGRVFPISEEKITCEDCLIKPEWAQLLGIDFGWDHPFGAVHCAWDRDRDRIYVTKCYRESQVTPLVHTEAIKPWTGKKNWVPVVWPQDGFQHDKGSGQQLSEIYKDHGLRMHYEHSTHPEGGHGTEAGIAKILEMMMTDRFKVFESCHDWFEEFRMYHRLDGRIVKERDDLMSATRMVAMMIREARTEPKEHKISYSSYPKYA